ncbi:hypothetical protein LCGC14_2057140 [marine sediment metagenome]|uniref:Uncharacterized protein n=1 Tax=marine sediment metagenome TaxID=412755 RepID=A0A0F9HJ96_9ZZZZ
MGKMTIVDDDGTILDYARFVAVGVNEEGEVSSFIEDDGLEASERVGMVVAGLSALADLSRDLVVEGEADPPATGPSEGGDHA